MLRIEFCRQRQNRLLEVLARLRLDAAVIALPYHVYYFTAHSTMWLHQSCFVLLADGRSWLACANEPSKEAAADEVVAYEAQWMATLRQEQPAVVAAMVADLLKSRKAKRIGTDASPVCSQVPILWKGEVLALDPELWQLRRRKDRDELELIKTAIRCSEAMYARAREIVQPGVQELEVFAELHAAAIKTAGEPMSVPLGNDFACGAADGPPRKDRAAKAAEIYILDLGPWYRWYFADNCRSFAVDRRPTDVQLNAWRAIVDSFPIIEKMARPGARCRDIYQAVSDHLQSVYGQALRHHLGHGIGLQPHEFPHFNPKWDDVLMEGEVFAVEPGLYGPELAGGIRIENNYLVTATGVQSLLHAPMELA